MAYLYMITAVYDTYPFVDSEFGCIQADFIRMAQCKKHKTTHKTNINIDLINHTLSDKCCLLLHLDIAYNYY